MSGFPYTSNAFTFYLVFKKQYIFRYMSGLDVIVEEVEEMVGWQITDVIHVFTKKNPPLRSILDCVGIAVKHYYALLKKY